MDTDLAVLHDRLGEVFTFGDARSAGLSQRRIYAMRDAGTLVVVGHGLFRRADSPPIDVDLVEITERAPRATLCLETALVHHELIDSIPTATHIAIPRGDHRPRLAAIHRLHTFDPATFELGRSTLDIGARHPIGIYSAERSLIDLIRLRHREGADLAWEALRSWLASPGRNPGTLIRMAGNFHGAARPLRQALEILL